MARHFRAAHDTTINELQRILKRMGATNLRVEQDHTSHEAVVAFDRNGRRYVYPNRNYQHTEDNLRAIRLGIEYMWKVAEVWGVSSSSQRLALDDLMAAYEATPGSTALLIGTGDWWDVLRVPMNADRATITNAYKALARVHHPDAGGDPREFIRVRKAYDEGLAKAAR